MWAAPIVSGAVPNALLRTTRTLEPPTLVARSAQRLIREVHERLRPERRAGRRLSRRMSPAAAEPDTHCA